MLPQAPRRQPLCDQAAQRCHRCSPGKPGLRVHRWYGWFGGHSDYRTQKSSAVERSEIPSRPPATRTAPPGKSVAECQYRG